MAHIIAYDLGTGGLKASLHSENGATLATSFHPYATFYPSNNRHEQRPSDWWDAVCASTVELLKATSIKPKDIRCLALSGHSQVAVPMDSDGKQLLDQVPIWSDSRAEKETEEFYEKISRKNWYDRTGGGDPPPIYTIMKLMWLRKNQPQIFAKTRTVLGSKDYINYRFTGEMAIDASYASGSGAFNLKNWDFDPELLAAAGIPRTMFPPMLPSHEIVGKVTREAAAATGLCEGTLVACGGVDNSCMALGARGIGEGRVYTSLGSSSWIAVTTQKPLVDFQMLPFTFAHIEKGYYTSATSIFAAGNAYQWVRDNLCADIVPEGNAYITMDALAAEVPAGSNGVIFNPSLSGGSAQEKSPNIRGAFMGLTMGNTRADLIRATMEGIAINLRLVMDVLERLTPLDDTMLLCGGGSKSLLWRKMFASIYNKKILKTNIDQDAASLGAAAIAARGCGLWRDYSPIDALHVIRDIQEPDPAEIFIYDKVRANFQRSRDFLADFGAETSQI